MHSMDNEGKDLLEPSRIKFINTWVEYQKWFILIN